MKKVIVIGCPGAGKSTFARKLRDRTSLPLYYLDMIWHRADGTNISREAFVRQVSEIVGREQWIIDGNYLNSLEMRLQECDTVFLLDYPTELCLDGVKERIGKKREDLPWVEKEFDREFRQWISRRTSSPVSTRCWKSTAAAGSSLFSGKERMQMHTWLCWNRGNKGK